VGIGSGGDLHTSGKNIVIIGKIYLADVVTATDFSVDGSTHALINGQADCNSFLACNTAGRVESGSSIALDAKAEAVALYASVSGLAATGGAPSGDLAASFTWTGNGGTNVASLNSVTLSSGRILTLNGTASDFFIFNITGGMAGSGSGAIVLGAEVNPDHVLFNFLCSADHGSTCGKDGGAGTAISFSGGFVGSGIILALDRDITENTPSGGWTGRFFSDTDRTIHFFSGATITGPETPPTSATPEPGTMVLLVIGLLGLALAGYLGRQRNRGSSASAAGGRVE
jgi:hypothetical protein